MKLHKQILLLIFLVIATCGFAQKYVIAEKIGHPKRIKFTIGDELIFTQFGNDTIYEDQISALTDSTIIFGNKVVLMNSISKIWIGKSKFWPSRLKYIGLYGGSLFFGIDTFNRLVNNDSPIVSRTGLIVLGTGLGIASLATITKKNWFRIKGNKQLRYLDTTIG